MNSKSVGLSSIENFNSIPEIETLYFFRDAIKMGSSLNTKLRACSVFNLNSSTISPRNKCPKIVDSIVDYDDNIRYSRILSSLGDAMYLRLLNLKQESQKKSLFLLGPRQTGKSTLIKQQFSSKDFPHFISLLKSSEFLRYQTDPGLLIKEFESSDVPLTIIIDEIQKLPKLLDDIHYLIEEKKHRFVLTGSSARKLKKEGVNLLGGRAKTIYFHPLVTQEIGLDKNFDLQKAMSFGMLPSIWDSSNPTEDLQDYVSTYLKEEIFAESVVRNLQKFSRLLEVAALGHGQIINYTKIGQDVGLSPSTIIEHYKILMDTLILVEVPSLSTQLKRKNIITSKYYFFDIGVTRTILKRRELKDNDADFGIFFESFIFQELFAYTTYKRLATLRYWRSTSDFEVDFILNDEIAIEVKSTKKILSEDFKGLKALQDEKKCSKYYLVSRDEKSQKMGEIEALPWSEFLQKLWSDLIFK